ncbi:plasmid mobilization protein [Bordetella bronchialis]|uniref:plasmid mobilization protein n=1 Tax=Bordetella bronchialis TaxID=463025 RepID=UPI003D058C94
MTDDTKRGRGTRPRGSRIEVWVTPDERAEIAARAAQSGMSLSVCMRAAGLNHPVRSVLDLKAVADLGRVNGDLGRVVGLLKLWLAEKRGQGASPVGVEALMKDLRALQAEMHRIMGGPSVEGEGASGTHGADCWGARRPIAQSRPNACSLRKARSVLIVVCYFTGYTAADFHLGSGVRRAYGEAWIGIRIGSIRRRIRAHT